MLSVFAHVSSNHSAQWNTYTERTTDHNKSSGLLIVLCNGIRCLIATHINSVSVLQRELKMKSVKCYHVKPWVLLHDECLAFWISLFVLVHRCLELGLCNLNIAFVFKLMLVVHEWAVQQQIWCQKSRVALAVCF